MSLQHHLKPISILSVTTLGNEVGPQDRRTLSHPFAHYWVYRKEALRVIGLHPLSWTAIEDTYLGALDRAWKNESQPKVVKASVAVSNWVMSVSASAVLRK